MRLTFRDKIFLVHEVKNSSAPLPAVHGFVWDKTHFAWITSDVTKAARLRDYADEEAKREIYRTYLVHAPWSGRLLLPRGLAPHPFQKPVVRFALERNRSFWWNDMGTGKGPCSAMVMNALAIKRPLFVLYVCPPELLFNVEAELRKWLIRDPQIEIFNKKIGPSRSDALIHVLILPDSMLTKYEWKNFIPALACGPALGVPWRERLLIVDEVDRFKNPETARTQALFGYEVKGEGRTPGLADRFTDARIIYMTGTAMPNGCPLELYPVLSHSAPETIDFADYYKFAFKYAVGEKSHFGWKFKDIKNEEEFRRRVYGKFLYRVKKDEHLDLPERIESALVVAADMKPKLAELDRRVLRSHSPEDLMREAVHLARGGKKGDEDDLNLATYRRLLGVEKVAPSVPLIKLALEKTSPLVFAIHTEVIDRLAAALAKYDPVIIDGRVPKEERHRRLEEWKKDKRHRPIIGNIAACARGFTLTKCSRVMFVEWGWVPGINDQAADRAHRIGQTSDVYIQYILFRNSVDMSVLETIFRKRKNNKNM